jgi:hypothetical protein
LGPTPGIKRELPPRFAGLVYEGFPSQQTEWEPAMRKRVLGSLSVCLATAGLALADGDPPGRLPAVDPPAATKDTAGKGTAPTDDKGTLGKLTPAPVYSEQGTGAASGMATAGTNGSSSGTELAKPNPLCDDHCGPGNQIWVNADYLLWWFKKGPLTVPVAAANDGTVLIGNSNIDYGNLSGGRLLAGLWLDDHNMFGFEAGGLALEKPTVSATVQSDAGGNPALNRPIVNATTGATNPVLISLPNAFAGGLTVSSSSRFWGTEANLVRNLAFCPEFTFDLKLGFRYLDLTETLNIVQNTTALAGGTIFFPDANGLPAANGAGASVSLTDSVYARNQFYGGQIGAHMSMKFERFHVDVDSQVALGPNHEVVAANGVSQLTTAAGVTSTASGGLLVLSRANIGRQSTDWFTVVPEVGVRLGYLITDNLRLHVGYSFLYINDVVRPGNQLTPAVNSILVPTSPNFGGLGGPAQPAPQFRQDSFWAHGINAGVIFRY